MNKNENFGLYLQMIQEPIGRMSTNSAIFKGFTAAIVAGIAQLSYKNLNIWVLILSFFPVLTFARLDAYYLQMERQYRYLYQQVTSGEHPIDFNLVLPNDQEALKAANATFLKCLFSKSVLGFYGVMVVIPLIVVGLKLGGII